MKRNLLSPPEPFTLSPMLSLLPVLSNVGKLESLKASLFARYEKVTALRKSAADSGAGDIESRRKIETEGNMLFQVLEWLDLKPEEQ